MCNVHLFRNNILVVPRIVDGTAGHGSIETLGISRNFTDLTGYLGKFIEIRGNIWEHVGNMSVKIAETSGKFRGAMGSPCRMPSFELSIRPRRAMPAAR